MVNITQLILYTQETRGRLSHIERELKALNEARHITGRVVSDGFAGVALVDDNDRLVNIERILREYADGPVEILIRRVEPEDLPAGKEVAIS